MKLYNLLSVSRLLVKAMGIVTVAFFLAWHSSAQAVLRAPAHVPEATPLQPIPEDTAPNISRNIEDQGTPLIPPAVDTLEDGGSGPDVDGPTQGDRVHAGQTVSSGGYGIGAGIVALLVIIIAGIATWRISRKPE